MVQKSGSPVDMVNIPFFYYGSFFTSQVVGNGISEPSNRMRDVITINQTAAGLEPRQVPHLLRGISVNCLLSKYFGKKEQQTNSAER